MMDNELKKQLVDKYAAVDWLDDVEIMDWWLSIRKWALAKGFTQQQLTSCKEFVWNGMKRPVPPQPKQHKEITEKINATGFYQSLGEQHEL